MEPTANKVGTPLLPVMRRPWTPGATIMSQVHHHVAEIEPADEVDSHRAHSPYPLWPPRLSTVIAGLFVGSSLFFVNFVDVEFAQNLSDMYGWPFSHHFQPVQNLGPSNAAAVADLVISVLLLASACVTTQMAACLLVRSPRLTVRILTIGVLIAAMLLAASRWKNNYLSYVLYGGFYYSVASFIVLILSVLLHLELPRFEDRSPRD
jgi:hypothetical protein